MPLGKEMLKLGGLNSILNFSHQTRY